MAKFDDLQQPHQVSPPSPENAAAPAPEAPQWAELAPTTQTTSTSVAPTPPKSTPPPAKATLGWRTGLVVAIVALLVGAMFLWRNANPQLAPASNTSPGPAIVQPAAIAPGQALTLTWHVVTAGPSPFNPYTWVARIELGATGGNNEYIFWVNGQRLPEASDNQFIVESQGCQPVRQFIGVTSNSQSARQELVVYPPESSSCPR